MGLASRPRLNHALLEQAIYGQVPLGRLIGDTSSLLADYRVADYVGSRSIDPARDPSDVSHATAQQFFEDQGAYLETLTDAEPARDFSIALFATFLVVEIRPLSPQTEFLVLAPLRPAADAPTPYLGLARFQNTDALREALRRAEARKALFESVDKLLRALAGSAGDRGRRPGLLRRLLGRD